VDSKSIMRQLLDYGVDGILTNYPETLKEVLNEEPYRGIYRIK
jgi:glycerophosphoryl diester phosphodiesterase